MAAERILELSVGARIRDRWRALSDSARIAVGCCALGGEAVKSLSSVTTGFDAKRLQQHLGQIDLSSTTMSDGIKEALHGKEAFIEQAADGEGWLRVHDEAELPYLRSLVMTEYGVPAGVQGA